MPNWVRALRDSGYRTSVIGKTHYYPYNGSVPDMREAEPYIQSLGYQDVDEIPGPRVSGTILSHMTAAWRDLGLMEMVRQDLGLRYSGNQAVARESVLPLEWYPDVYVGRKAVEYLSAYDRKEPFFCCVSFGGPHDPWDCPRDYAAPFDNAVVPEPLPAFKDRNPARPRGTWDKRPEYPGFSPEDAASIRRNYAGKVSLIDDQIGKILALLETRGLRDKTLVVFSSDHGEMNGDQGRLYKSNFLESALRVPLIIDIPGHANAADAKNSICDALVELVDLGPTFLEAAGVESPRGQMGRSVLGCMDSAGKRNHQTRHREFQISEYDHEAMIFDGRWKLAANAQGEAYLLFDLDRDPGEQENLACDGAHDGQQMVLLAQLEAFKQATSSQLLGSDPKS
jgi:choline-sulfatase